MVQLLIVYMITGAALCYLVFFLYNKIRPKKACDSCGLAKAVRDKAPTS